MTDKHSSPGNADARDFYNMSGPDLLAYCGEDASKWAEAFCKIKEAQGWSANDIDEGLMITWFANAIEHSSHIRTAVPAQEAQHPEGDTKLVYVKRWRTLVRLPVKYADEIVEVLRSSAVPSTGLCTPEGDSK